MSKQVTIYLSRKLTLNRPQAEPLELAAGRNMVDEEVAAHPFVQHHTVDAAPDNSAEVDALHARVVDLEDENKDLADALRASRAREETARVQLDAARGEAAQLSEQLDAAHVAGLTAAARVAELEANMAALVASMTPAEAKGKSK